MAARSFLGCVLAPEDPPTDQSERRFQIPQQTEATRTFHVKNIYIYISTAFHSDKTTHRCTKTAIRCVIVKGRRWAGQVTWLIRILSRRHMVMNFICVPLLLL